MKWLVTLLFSVLLLPAQTQAADEPEARVLYINSYHRGYSWSDGLEEGLRQALLNSGKRIELSTEYLDSRRFAYGKQIGYIAEAMKIRYSRYRPDLVIVSDNAAFDFIIKYRQDLFAGVPVVFCGYNNFRPEVLAGQTGITGVNEEIDIGATVEMALKIHPAATTLVFVTSTGEESSRRIREVAERAVFPALGERFNVVVLNDNTQEEVAARLKTLPPTTLVFITGQIINERSGRAISPTENGELITAASPFPVYTQWDFNLGSGAVGGHIITADQQGREAARLALLILNGTPADAIPVVMESPTTNIFDYRAMQHWNIKPDRLPPGSIMINRPDTLWGVYKNEIIAVLIVVVLQTLLIVLLLWNIQMRRRAQAEKKIQEQLLIQQSKMAAMGEMIGVIAHQWKQPLNTLGILMDDIFDAHEHGELTTQYLEKTVSRSFEQIRFMSQTIEDFRNFLRPTKEKTVFDAAEATRVIVHLFSPQFEKRSIQVEIAVLDQESYPVLGMISELQQAVLILLTNAREAIETKRKKEDKDNLPGKIRITFARLEGKVVLRMEDNGGGIPTAVIKRIFEPYVTTKGEGGTGIGLYMSRTIISENMKGMITAENGTEGAVFTVALPLAG